MSNSIFWTINSIINELVVLGQKKIYFGRRFLRGNFSSITVSLVIGLFNSSSLLIWWMVQIGLFILFSSLHNPDSSEQCCNCCCRVSILSDHTIKKILSLFIIIPEILRSILQRTSSSRIKLLISLPGYTTCLV